MTIRLLIFASLLITNALVQAEPAAEWREFRGAGGASVAASSDLPLEWNVETGKNVAWQAELPGRGVSSPIIVGGKVIVTASSGLNRSRLHVVAFDAETGKQLWHRQSWATGRTLCHPASANAAPTPTSDGERIFAFYSSNDLICYDLNGNLLWYRGLVLDHPRLGNDVGMSASPVTASGVVVVQCECQGNSFAAGIDCKTGETAWELDRPASANWSSPTLTDIRSNNETQAGILLQSTKGSQIFSINDGRELWSSPVAASLIPSSASQLDTVYLPADGVTALKLEESGSVTVLWKNDRLKPGNPSPIVSQLGLCVMSRAGVLTMADFSTGDQIWKRRVGGSYWATPVAVGERLYALDDRGSMSVVDLNSGKVIAKSSFGEEEQTYGSPAVAGDAMYVRSHNFLWKIAK